MMSNFISLFSRFNPFSKGLERTPPLLNLPIELLDEIVNSLDLPTVWALSNTCGALRCILWPRIRDVRHRMSTSGRINLIHDSAWLLPDYWPCSSCRCLHVVDVKDLPVCNKDKEVYDRIRCPFIKSGKGRTLERYPLSPYYILEFRHVHTAVKCQRSTGSQKKYQSRLLAHFEVSNRHTPDKNFAFSVTPKLVGDHFLILVQWSYHGKGISSDYFANATFQICPHLGNSWMDRRLDNQLLETLAAAYRDLRVLPFIERWVYGSCRYCPTDYALCIKDKGQRVTITSWQDLGMGQSTDDPHWNSHIWLEGDNDRDSAKLFPYEPGTVRRVYKRN